MKRFTSLLVLLTVSISAWSVAYADEALTDETNVTSQAEEAVDEPEVYTLSLNDAIELAMTDNPQIIANEYEQTAKEINIKSAYLDKSAMKKSLKAASDYNKMSVTTMQTLLVKEGFGVAQAEMEHRMSILEAEQIKASIAYNTTNAYYNVVLMDKLVNAAKNSYDLALDNKAVVDAQYELGLVAQMVYDNADISVDGAKSMLEAYELNREIALLNLKNTLNINKNSEVILIDEIESEEFESDVEADAAAALETRYDLTNAKEGMELAYLNFDISGAFTSSSAAYNTAYSSYIDAQYGYDKARDLVELSIHSAYNTILTNHSAMDIARRTYEMKLKEYDASKLQYELGMITNLELTDKINALYDAQVDYAQKKLDYRMSVEKYKYDITIGLPQQ